MRTSWVGLSITTNKNKLGLNCHNSWWVGPVCLLIHLYSNIQTDKTCSLHNQHNTTMAEEISRRMRATAQQHAERVEEIFRRMRAAGQQQTERASGKWLFIYLCMHIYFCFHNSEPLYWAWGTNIDVDIFDQGNLLTHFEHCFTHKVQSRRRYFWPRQSSNTFWALFYTQSPKSTSIFLTKAIF